MATVNVINTTAALNDTQNSSTSSADESSYLDTVTGYIVASTFENTTTDILEAEEAIYWELGWRVFFAVSLSVILLGAVIGNIMVIMVMMKHRGMRTRTNMFLCSLACSDLLCALLNMPISLTTVINGHWIFGNTLCQINGFLTPFTFVTSIHTLMYIAVHKYISIKWPFSHVLTHFRILLMILCAWLWGGVASYLTMHGLNSVSYKPYTTQCGPDYPHDGRTYFHEGFIYITCYLVPLLVMAFCYIVMCYEIKAHALRMVLSTTTDKDVIFMQQRRITFTLFLVLITFMLCWTPHVIYAAYTTILTDKRQVPSLANPLVYWLGYLNCACNPIIYALRSPAFREGYRQLFCWQSPRHRHDSRRRHSSGQHKPLGRFRAFLRENLRGTLHASGSLTGSPVASPPTSRKSSMTSLTNYLLFPKSRTLSTNSLPGNFRFSVPPLIIDKDTTQVSFIAGIPVLTKGGKIVTYTNPHEKRRTNPVYYPKLSHLERTLLREDNKPRLDIRHKVVTEKSPLIPRSHAPSQFSNAEVSIKPGRPAFPAPELSLKPRLGQSMLSPHIEVPEIFIEADIEEELREMGSDMPRFTARPSCESGFNDGEHLSDEDNDDQVFIVVADIERPPRDLIDSSPQTSSERDALLLDDASSDERSARSAEIEDSSELLRVPGPGITRQRVCKSVSDACDRKRPVMIGRLVTKSTSDTCIKENKDKENATQSDETPMEPVEKKTSDKSIRRKILNRFFSRKTKGGSPKSSAHSSRIDMRGSAGGGDIVDDISDSGMVSGVSGMHESPAIPRAARRAHGKERSRDITSHSFSMADSKHRKAATLDNRSSGSGVTVETTEKGAEPEVPGHKALALSRSSSDPSMSSSKSKQPQHSSKHRPHDKRASKARSKSRRSHDKSKRRSREMELNLTNSGVSHRAGDLQRSKSMKAGKYPSVEKLDRDRIGSEASAVKRKLKRTGGSSALPTANDRTDTATRSKQERLAQMMELQPLKVFHYTEAHYMRRYRGHKLYRCVSDPGLTFKKIEEKVLQRSATRKWQRTHKRYQRRTTNMAGTSGKDSLNLTDTSDQDYRSLAMDSSILTSSSTSKSPDGDHSNQFSDSRYYASSSHNNTPIMGETARLGESLFQSPEVTSSASASGGSPALRSTSGFRVATSQEEHSGKYLLVSVPLNETSPICLSNLSLHHIQSEQAMAGHVTQALTTSGHVTDGRSESEEVDDKQVQKDLSSSASFQITNDPQAHRSHDPPQPIMYNPTAPNFSALQQFAEFADESPNGHDNNHHKSVDGFSSNFEMCSNLETDESENADILEGTCVKLEIDFDQYAKNGSSRDLR